MIKKSSAFFHLSLLSAMSFAGGGIGYESSPKGSGLDEQVKRNLKKSNAQFFQEKIALQEKIDKANGLKEFKYSILGEKYTQYAINKRNADKKMRKVLKLAVVALALDGEDFPEGLHSMESRYLEKCSEIYKAYEEAKKQKGS